MELPKLNALAMNRRSKYCMEPIVADSGQMVVSCDLTSAEPNILLNLSGDVTLYAILYEMNGKRPYRDSRGFLMTNSLYITTMSITPLLAPKIAELGEPWLDLYKKDADAAKDALGAPYKVCKGLCLAMIYGMQHRKLQKECVDADFNVTEEEAKAIISSFWASIPQARALRDRILAVFNKAKEEKRPFCNPFGFPLPTGKPKDSMNLIIQSSVSSWVRHLGTKLYPQDWFNLIAIIHDEFIFQVPENRTEEFRNLLTECVAETNEQFKLAYPLQLGWKVAKSFGGFK